MTLLPVLPLLGLLRQRLVLPLLRLLLRLPGEEVAYAVHQLDLLLLLPPLLLALLLTPRLRTHRLLLLLQSCQLLLLLLASRRLALVLLPIDCLLTSKHP